MEIYVKSASLEVAKTQIKPLVTHQMVMLILTARFDIQVMGVEVSTVLNLKVKIQ